MSKTLSTLIAEYQQIQADRSIQNSKAADFIHLFNSTKSEANQKDYQHRAIFHITERNRLDVRLGEIERQIEKIKFPE